ncbi:hypothetical protein [Sphingomonas japonica]|uniref:DUF2059 domain-containing protein n=1 Tax=Sphingomonas japonica TaxID=511662 RepID=A0ABX0U4D5_9SPHN|nr:hypothetical protein [Sphingomonas japonica]NIJ24251.1 hypothetical protein [Sphingomonas japonica]
MLLLFTALFLQTAAAPSAEAEALGLRLAQAGTLASIAPMLIEKDLGELAAEDSSLTPAERDRLLEIGRTQGRAGYARVTAAIGHAYAKRLSVADLTLLVAHAEDPAARRFSAAVPGALAEAMQGIGTIDLKKDVAAAFCRDTGKLCDRD